MSIAVVAGNAVADPDIGLLAVLRWCPGRSPLVCAAAVPFARAGPCLPAPARSSGRRLRGQGRRSRAQRSLEGGGAVA